MGKFVSKWMYTIIGGLLALVGASAFGLSWWTYGKHVGNDIVTSGPAWGVFGDFIGGFAGTVIALATLIALAITIHLQAGALKEARNAFEQQGQATQDQLNVIKLTEALKLRPLLKAEWFPSSHPNSLEWRIRNIGRGPAILDHIELYVRGDRIGAHSMVLDSAMIDAWRAAVKAVLGFDYEKGLQVAILPINDLKRAIGANEAQATVMVSVASDRDLAVAILNTGLDAVIHFRSVAGETLSTRTQFDAVLHLTPNLAPGSVNVG